MLLIAGGFADGSLQQALLIGGLLTTVPGFLYLFICTIWHWKDRYRGNHSDLWGALLMIESSGWFKLVYLFRHIVPDARQVGRYAAAHPSPHRLSDDSESGQP